MSQLHLQPRARLHASRCPGNRPRRRDRERSAVAVGRSHAVSTRRRAGCVTTRVVRHQQLVETCYQRLVVLCRATVLARELGAGCTTHPGVALAPTRASRSIPPPPLRPPHSMCPHTTRARACDGCCACGRVHEPPRAQRCDLRRERLCHQPRHRHGSHSCHLSWLSPTSWSWPQGA